MASAADPLLVLYGSETGNARDVAERIAREAARGGDDAGPVHCLSMDRFEVTQLPTAPLVVCVCSTTGQGDPPANMRDFWRFLLRKSLPADSLNAVRFAVFGLGDSHYQKYNVAAKRLHRRLLALGARELLDLGLGDDQHPTGYEATLDPWLERLWRALGRTVGPRDEWQSATQWVPVGVHTGGPVSRARPRRRGARGFRVRVRVRGGRERPT